jgi:hypothetical protein
MAPKKDPQRVLLGRLGAYTLHSRYDSHELVKPARKAFESKFEREVDPEGVLPRDERLRRAEMARKAHFARLAYLSAKARGKRRASAAPRPTRWNDEVDVGPR